MAYSDDGGTSQQNGLRGNIIVRNVIGSDEQRHRLSIYRAGLARMRAGRLAGVPPVQASWRAACQLAEMFDLDTQVSGLLVGCLVAARDG